MPGHEKHVNRILAALDDLDEIDPNSVEAILYRPKDDVDRQLAEFAQDIA